MKHQWSHISILKRGICVCSKIQVLKKSFNKRCQSITIIKFEPDFFIFILLDYSFNWVYFSSKVIWLHVTWIHKFCNSLKSFNKYNYIQWNLENILCEADLALGGIDHLPRDQNKFNALMNEEISILNTEIEYNKKCVRM